MPLAGDRVSVDVVGGGAFVAAALENTSVVRVMPAAGANDERDRSVITKMMTTMILLLMVLLSFLLLPLLLLPLMSLPLMMMSLLMIMLIFLLLLSLS